MFGCAEGGGFDANRQLDFTKRPRRHRDDIYAEDSIELLKHSGIDFAKNEVCPWLVLMYTIMPPATQGKARHATPRHATD